MSYVFRIVVNKNLYIVTRLKTATLIPLQNLIIDCANGIDVLEFRVVASKLIAKAINDKKITAKLIEAKLSDDELSTIIQKMRDWCMSILGGSEEKNQESKPKTKDDINNNLYSVIYKYVSHKFGWTPSQIDDIYLDVLWYLIKPEIKNKDDMYIDQIPGW